MDMSDTGRLAPQIQADLEEALARTHRLGTIGGDLQEQIAHCVSFSAAIDVVLGDVGVGADGQRGCDLGTGGGLPGLVLAEMRPAWHWTLVDMRTARADEVERVVLRLGLAGRVRVVATEAQKLAHDLDARESYDVVVARAFGPSSITAECAAGLVCPGGVFVVSEPPNVAEDPDRWNLDGLAYLGFDEPRRLEVDELHFSAFLKSQPAPPTIPRLPPRQNRGWPGS